MYVCVMCVTGYMCLSVHISQCVLLCHGWPSLSHCKGVWLPPTRPSSCHGQVMASDSQRWPPPRQGHEEGIARYMASVAHSPSGSCRSPLPGHATCPGGSLRWLSLGHLLASARGLRALVNGEAMAIRWMFGRCLACSGCQP